MSILERYWKSFLRFIFRHRRLSQPKEPKLKIRNKLDNGSRELEEALARIEEYLSNPSIPQTTKDLLQSLLRSTMILKETEIDKEMIERISWFPRMLIEPDDFSVWLSTWMEDQLNQINAALDTMEVGV